jgi:UDP-glucose 4-epimerase
MKKVVITGALGFLGSKLTEELVRSFPSIEICAIDDLSSSNAQIYAKKKSCPLSFLKADILQTDLEFHFKNANIVFHLAAIADPASSFEDRARVERINCEGMKRVAQACIKTNSLLIFPSTTSVYAKPSGMIFEKEASRWIAPQTPYAESKLRAERILEDFSETEGLKFMCLRLGTVFGVSEGMHFRTAIQKFCKQAVSEERLSVWASALHQIRPYCDLSDAVRAMIFCAQRPEFLGKMIHGATEHATLLQIATRLKEFFPSLSIETVSHQAMNDYSYEVDCGLLKRSGFEFKGSLRAGIADVIDKLQQSSKCLAEN